ncbi:MAG: hypothetical protein JW863_21165 [Chitinispirillaceae bacterium]|nr:hypothetical protein [Chitinispirillaceae bacterium]
MINCCSTVSRRWSLNGNGTAVSGATCTLCREPCYSYSWQPFFQATADTGENITDHFGLQLDDLTEFLMNLLLTSVKVTDNGEAS